MQKMVTGNNARERVKLSVGGLSVGIFLGIIYFLLLVAAPRFFISNVLGQSISGFGLSSDLFSLFKSDFFLGVVIVLIVVEIAHRAVRKPMTLKGPQKVALGTVNGIIYYLVLGGGAVFVSASFAPISLTVSITLVIMLALLELSAVLKISQGIIEFREGRNMKVKSKGAPARDIMSNVAQVVQRGVGSSD